MAKNDKKVRIFSALEVANICGVVNQTTINWIKNGYLKAFTTPGGQYRIYAEDLLGFLETRGMRIPEELHELTEKSVGKRYMLLVDDDVELNNLVASFLRRKMPDFTIDQAFDGFEAGVKLKELNPEVVLLDIDLPGVDGHHLCSRIKGDESFGSPLVIVVSGMSDPAEKDRILAEGADSFFGKPVKLEVLLEGIQSLL